MRCLAAALAGIVAAVGGMPVNAQGGQTPRVAVIIDDMGQHAARGERALALPGPLAYAFLPQAPHTRDLAGLAHRRGKEVLLHQPMQAAGREGAGPGRIALATTREALQRRVARNLAAVPHAAGVNNHEGSLITRHPGHMTWLMKALRERGGLFFVDSRTTARTVAERMAREVGVPAIERDIFLDHRREATRIHAQFDRLLATARREGAAVAIGHPHPQTLAVLKNRLRRLQEADVELVAVSALVSESSEEADAPWHVSSSP
jgi:polysaccharide deacetylase 2 family uncharacterized protein YibQ